MEGSIQDSADSVDESADTLQHHATSAAPEDRPLRDSSPSPAHPVLDVPLSSSFRIDVYESVTVDIDSSRTSATSVTVELPVAIDDIPADDDVVSDTSSEISASSEEQSDEEAPIEDAMSDTSTETSEPPEKKEVDPEKLAEQEKLLEEIARQERVMLYARTHVEGGEDAWDLGTAVSKLLEHYVSVANSSAHRYLKNQCGVNRPKASAVQQASAEVLEEAISAFDPADAEGERFRGHLQTFIEQKILSHYRAHH